MAKLHGLIKFRQHELDEKRRELGDINAKIAKLQQRKEAMLQQMEAEKKAAANSADSLIGVAPIGSYISKVLKQREQLNQAIEQIILESEEIMEQVRMAFLELKKLEITQERRDHEEMEHLHKMEQAILDEIALVRHNHQKLQKI